MPLNTFNPFRWKKRYLFLLLGAIALIWLLFLDTYSIWTRYQLNERKEKLIDKTEQLQRETAHLKEKIRDIKTDSALLERIAREKYGMQKKGETVYKVRMEE